LYITQDNNLSFIGEFAQLTVCW